MQLQTIFREIDEKEPELIRTRRDLHRYAESGWREFRTTSVVVQRLTALGYDVRFGRAALNPDKAWARPDEEELRREQRRAVAQGADPALVERMEGYTGAVTVLETGRPGPVLALRFDIDCNDVDESCESSHRPRAEGFASVNAHQMHACGHDGHTAIGLAVAELLQRHREELCGTIKLIFQPAEEGDRGSAAVVGSGFLDDVDTVLAVHIYDSRDGKPGFAGTQTGLYATTKFDVTIRGRSAHAGAAPQEGSSAINAACLAILGMQSFLQDGRGSGRLNVGTIAGGTGRNVIPELCVFRAETRGSDTEVEQRLYHRALETVQGACTAFGCSFETQIRGICPTGDGDLDLAERLTRAMAAVPDFAHRQAELKQTGGTDDFACMMEAVHAHGGKACYMALLTPLAAGLHNDAYDFDESILKAGVKAFLTAVDLLTGEAG